jgi:hypothetical protein
MLEILILVALIISMGKKMRAKGRTAIGYQFMLFGLWLTFEIIGFAAGWVMSGGGHDGVLAIVGCALAGGILGEVIAFCIAGSLPAVTRPQYTPGVGLYPVAPNLTRPQV